MRTSEFDEVCRRTFERCTVDTQGLQWLAVLLTFFTVVLAGVAIYAVQDRARSRRLAESGLASGFTRRDLKEAEKSRTE